MNRVTTIFESPAVVIERFDHPAGQPHRDGASEMTRKVAVTFVESGKFEVRQDRTWWSFGERDVLASVPGLVRRYRHFQECPDDVCETISFAPEVVEDALGDLRRRPSRPPRVGDGTAPRFARFWLKSALASRDPLWVEEAAFHCTLALISPSWAGPGQASRGLGHARRIRRAIEFMAARLAGPCSLTLIAREVAMSPFHFARVFAELTGVSPHQYLLRLRLRQAARMLREGASVTAAAMSSGFENLSHFSRTFRRRFGVRPMRYAARP